MTDTTTQEGFAKMGSFVVLYSKKSQARKNPEEDSQQFTTRPEEIKPLSAYLDLDEYNDHEEKHIYYVEMRRYMLDVISGYQKEAKRSVKVLENGAGTGLFSSHLLSIEGLNVTLLEPDERSRKVLQKQLGTRLKNHILEMGAEELTDNNYWDLVVSSFSHDHIKDGGRLAHSIYNALKVGGIYISGVEILRDYESDDDRIDALYKWHSFVIDDAREKREMELAKLENEALVSGVNGIADFKKDIAHFEEDFNAVGNFKQIIKTKIGSLTKPGIGGVYVFGYQKVV